MHYKNEGLVLINVTEIPESYSRYSVMQSDGNSLFRDVVLDRFNRIYRDKDSI